MNWYMYFIYLGLCGASCFWMLVQVLFHSFQYVRALPFRHYQINQSWCPRNSSILCGGPGLIKSPLLSFFRWEISCSNELTWSYAMLTEILIIHKIFWSLCNFSLHFLVPWWYECWWCKSCNVKWKQARRESNLKAQSKFIAEDILILKLRADAIIFQRKYGISCESSACQGRS